MMATKSEVIHTYFAHTDWDSHDIATHLRCTSGYVRATLQRNGLAARKSKGRREKPKPALAVVISPEEQAEREQDHRDLDMLADIDEGHTETQVAAHWGVTRNYVHNLRKNAKVAA